MGRTSNASFSRAGSGLTDFQRIDVAFQRASSGLTDLQRISKTVFSRAGSGLTDLQRTRTSQVNTQKRSSKMVKAFKGGFRRSTRTATNSSFKRTNSGRLLRI